MQSQRNPNVLHNLCQKCKGYVIVPRLRILSKPCSFQLTSFQVQLIDGAQGDILGTNLECEGVSSAARC
jgi:hypothetical protein